MTFMSTFIAACGIIQVSISSHRPKRVLTGGEISLLENVRVLTKKIYVGNLSFDATEAQVNELFAQFGTVQSIAMITDRDSGRFRGFCFVEMEDSAANAAINALNETELDGRALKVNEARPREERSGGGGNYNRQGNNRGYQQNRNRNNW